jgi:hypothetical protein
MSFLNIIKPLRAPFSKENISKLPKHYGVYLLFAEGASSDGIWYVGAAGYGQSNRTIRNRLREHHRACEKELYKKDSNARIHNHIRKYGIQTLYFAVLEVYDEQPSFEALEERETFWIQEFSVLELVNAGLTANPRKGVKLTEEQIAALCVRQKAFWAAMSQEEREARVRPMLESRTSEELSRQVTERWNSLSDEEKKAWGDAISERMLAEPEELRRARARERFARCPIEVRARFSNFTPEQRIQYGLESVARATPEEMQERGRMGAAARKANDALLTFEELGARNKKAWETRLNNNPNAREAVGEQARQINANRTPEEYQEIIRKGLDTMGPEGRKKRALKQAQNMGAEKLIQRAQKAIKTRRANLLATTGSDKIPGPKNRVWSSDGKKRIGDANRNRPPEIIKAAMAKREAKREAKKEAGTDPAQIRFEKLKEQVLVTFPQCGATTEDFLEFLKTLGWSRRGMQLLLDDGTVKGVEGFGANLRYFLSSVDPEPFRGDITLLPRPGCRAKITEEHARQVFQLRLSGMPKEQIGKQLGVTGACVRQILSGRTWQRVYLEFSAKEKELATKNVRLELLKEKIPGTFPKDGLTFAELVLFLKEQGYSEGVIPTLSKDGIIRKVGGHRGKWVIQNASGIACRESLQESAQIPIATSSAK